MQVSANVSQLLGDPFPQSSQKFGYAYDAVISPRNKRLIPFIDCRKMQVENASLVLL